MQNYKALISLSLVAGENGCCGIPYHTPYPDIIWYADS